MFTIPCVCKDFNKIYSNIRNEYQKKLANFFNLNKLSLINKTKLLHALDSQYYKSASNRTVKYRYKHLRIELTNNIKKASCFKSHHVHECEEIHICSSIFYRWDPIDWKKTYILLLQFKSTYILFINIKALYQNYWFYYDEICKVIQLNLSI